MSEPDATNQRMAQLLNLHPERPDTWPTELLDRLALLEMERGREALLREVTRLLSPR
jgi:hypothetical protein